ncbi:Histidine kinase-, DNA gyrase B-, and HSP90-like ATPase [Nocardioides exalbidus]|uniref:Histidine kinase-, DNA gyrase B-, and HSP90-like ATPase n=1 Tax=Nocardioides exalbidus TaxID=402596 RepID=A0A1H4N198_9ACTN|nr:ATP-binding protein [Nocardioides exalbidus]SEB88648.1 Histidine kinase-, DNA gyrase B-, and HSP90-like ATPase [Nocardioides exalbidus]
MVFSGDPAQRRTDLLAVVSVLHVDVALERAATIGAERTRAGAYVLTVVDEVLPGTGPWAQPIEPVEHARGISAEAARDLRARIGAAGLQGEPGGRPGHDVIRLHDPADGSEVLRIPVVVGGCLFADLLLLSPPEGGFADDDVASISVLGRVAGVAVRNAQSYEFNDRRRQVLELVAAIEQSVEPPFELAEPYARVAAAAQRIASARTAAVVSATPRSVDVSGTAGVVDEVLPEVLDRIAERLQVAQDLDVDLVVRIGDHTVWGVPLRPELARRGVVLLVLDQVHGRLTRDDRSLMSGFVRHAALILDHAVLQSELQHAMLADDRDRIARDLHDVVIQRLYATALKLRAGIRTDGDPGGHIAEAVREIGDSIRDVRGAVFQLEQRRSGSLRGDVLGMAKEYEKALGFVPAVRTWGAVDSLVPIALGDQASVVLREVLSNCARHARASRCDVDLGVDESGWFSLVVTDDGRGVPEDTTPGSGLRNLRMRAETLGGELRVEPCDPHGTRVSWRVPLGAQPSAGPGAADGSSAGAAASASAGDGPGVDQTHSEAIVSSSQDNPETTR